MESESTQVTIVLFGEFSLSYKGRVVAEKDYRSQKMWAVLAYLILNRRRPATQAELIEKFWDDEEGQNPSGALKTLIFRLRKLLTSQWGEECQPILSTWGAYQWNPELPCKVDVDEFEELLRRSEAHGVTRDQQMEYYRRAFELYHGEFLPKANHLTWHTMQCAYYHSQFCQASYQYILLLESVGQYEEMTRVCNHTLRQGVLEENLYASLIRSLLKQGNHAQALRQYEKAADLLYRELGVSRSSVLKPLYQQIMNKGLSEQGDFEVILQDMREDTAPTACFCEYEVFKTLYRMEVRRTAHGGANVYIVLLTLCPPEGRDFSQDGRNRALELLKETLTVCLRRSDAAAQYSGTQVVVLLPDTDCKSSRRICTQIEETFARKCRRHFAELHCTFRPVEPTGMEGVTP